MNPIKFDEYQAASLEYLLAKYEDGLKDRKNAASERIYHPSETDDAERDLGEIEICTIEIMNIRELRRLLAKAKGQDIER